MTGAATGGSRTVRHASKVLKALPVAALALFSPLLVSPGSAYVDGPTVSSGDSVRSKPRVSYELLKAGLAVNELNRDLLPLVGVEPTPVAEAVAELIPSAAPAEQRPHAVSRGRSNAADAGTEPAASEEEHTEEEGEEHTHTLDESTAEERTIALVAEAGIDPALFEPKKTDSPKTTAARAALEALAADLEQVLASYEQAEAAAQEAAAAAEKAEDELERARARAKGARKKYHEDRELLVEIVNKNYEQASLSPLVVLMTAEDSHELVSGMAHLEQLGVNRADVVDTAEKSAQEMSKAAKAADDANAKAQAAAQAAAVALAKATEARKAVVANVVTAQKLLEDSELADQAATSLEAATKDGEKLQSGSVVFPLPEDSGYVDQNNWGNSGSNWGSVHTGNDFSVGCGTPVRAATDGTITIRTDQGWSGPWLVTVSTGEGRLTTWYAHMQAITVADGDQVTAGQVIGAVGSEGNSTGCHLHFEYHPMGGSIYEDSADPVAWLKATGAYPGA